MSVFRWIFGPSRTTAKPVKNFNRELREIRNLLNTVTKQQETIMTAIEELRTVAIEIAADAAAAHDQVNIALDFIVKKVDHDPEIMEVVDSLRTSHVTFTESLKALKDKVDSVMASGGESS